MCSGSEAGSYLRLIDFVYHSTLGLRVIKKKKEMRTREERFVSKIVDCLDLAASSSSLLSLKVLEGP